MAPNLNRRLARAWTAHAAAHDGLYEAAIGSGLAELAMLNHIETETDLVSILLGRINRCLVDGQIEMAAAQVAGPTIGKKTLNARITRTATFLPRLRPPRSPPQP